MIKKILTGITIFIIVLGLNIIGAFLLPMPFKPVTILLGIIYGIVGMLVWIKINQILDE